MPASFRGRTSKPPQPPAFGTPRQEVPVDPHHGVQADPHQLSRNLDSPKFPEYSDEAPALSLVRVKKGSAQANNRHRDNQGAVPVKAEKVSERAGNRTRGGPGARPPEG